MQGYKYVQIMNPFFEMPTDYKEAVKVYKTLAKTADQRLVRLENYHENDAEMGRILEWSYARAQRDIRQWSGEDATRFNTKPPETIQQLLAKIEDIKTFLSSESSTKQGIKKIMQDRADTFNEKFGTSYSWDEVGKFFDSELYEKMDSAYGSRTVQKALGVIQKNKKKILDAIKKKKEIYVTVDQTLDPKTGKVVSSGKALEKTVNKILKNYGKEVEEYLKL